MSTSNFEFLPNVGLLEWRRGWDSDRLRPFTPRKLFILIFGRIAKSGTEGKLRYTPGTSLAMALSARHFAPCKTTLQRQFAFRLTTPRTSRITSTSFDCREQSWGTEIDEAKRMCRNRLQCESDHALALLQLRKFLGGLGQRISCSIVNRSFRVFPHRLFLGSTFACSLLALVPGLSRFQFCSPLGAEALQNARHAEFVIDRSIQR